MYIHLVIQHPKPEHIGDMLASMRRVDKAAQGSPGLIQIGAWRDQDSDRLVGLAIWETPDAFHAAAEQIFKAVADDPFDQWCERPPDILHLTQP
jgi:heme-degrading monooxygenase HmoA